METIRMNPWDQAGLSDLLIELDIADIDILGGIDILERARYIAVFFHEQGVFSRQVALEPEISELVGLQTLFAAVSPGQCNRDSFPGIRLRPDPTPLRLQRTY